MDTLYYGDNLSILRQYIADETVDLVYLDPPFNSNANYNVLFAEKDGSQAASQIKAFDDTWHWTLESERQYCQTVEGGGKVADALIAFRHLLGANDMLAYLTMMAPRLVELRRVLKPTGSLYLHCDETAAHYLKVLLDAVFTPLAFRTEIIWQRTNVHSDSKCWSDVRDSILYYSKAGQCLWNPQYLTYTDKYVEEKYRHVEPETGRRYTLDNMTSPAPRPNMMYEWMGHGSPPNGWRYEKSTMQRLHDEGRVWYPEDKRKRPRLKRYLDEMPGLLLGNVWTDIPPINSRAQERLGYPTQKPEALLERIISASSNEGDLVLDPFCGCGTTIAAAQKLGRRWIGIDVTYLSIGLMRRRLEDSFGDTAQYEIIGEPTTAQDAAALADQDKFQFEWWALDLVHARPADPKKGADKGIDGRIYFHDEPVGGQAKQIIVSVKGGTVHSHHIRDLVGTVQREGAALGVLVTLHEPTRQMREEAASAGFYSAPWDETLKAPKIQILTIAELLAGKKIEYNPVHQAPATFKQAPKARGKQARTIGMELEENRPEDD